MVNLGETVKAERKRRDWTLAAVCDALEDEGADVDISMLKKMEDGTRPGSPKVWGKLWRIFRLPLAELYEGLELPVPSDIPTGIDGEIHALVQGMPDDAKQMVYHFARQAPSMVAEIRPMWTERQDPVAPTLRRAAESGLEYGESVGSEHGSAPRSGELLDTSWQKPGPTRKARS